MHLSSQRPILACTILLTGLLATGCSTATPPSSVATPANVTGDWSFAASMGGGLIAAGLIDTDGKVTGAATVTGCGSGAQQIVVQGAVSNMGILTLSTGQLAGGSVLQLKGQLGSDGKTIGNVTLSSSSSSCDALVAEELKGQVYAPATGSYTGTFTGSDQVQTPVTATLSQNTNPGAGGSYTLTGSISFPSSPCLGTGAATIVNGSTVTGSTLNATYTTTVSGQPVTITAVGTADPDATAINVRSWTISGGVCDGYSGTGQLTALSH